MARRRRKKRTKSEPEQLPEEKKTRPREFFETSQEYHEFLLKNMKPGYVCRVTNAGKLYIGPYRRSLRQKRGR